MKQSIVRVKQHREVWPQVYEFLENGKTTKYHVLARKVGYDGPQKKKFNKLKDALEYASDISKKVKNDGVKEAVISAYDRHWLLEGKKMLEPFNVTLEEVFKQALANQLELQKKNTFDTIETLVNQWLTERFSGKFKNNSKKTLVELKHKGQILVNKWGKLKAIEITRKLIEDALTSKTWDTPNGYLSKRSQINYHSKFNQFFLWVKEQKHQITFNPCDGIRFEADKIKKKIALLPLPQVRQLLFESKKLDIDMHVYFILCLFGGLRPEEAQQMLYENLFYNGKDEIFVAAWSSKTRKDRYIRMEPTLKSWLDALNNEGLLKKKGKLFLTNFAKRFSTIRIKCGFRWTKGINRITKLHNGFHNPNGLIWGEDCMRHNFGTYQLVKNPDINFLALEMGNSVNVIKQNYRLPVTASESDDYFNILPNTIEKQIELDLATSK